MPKNIKYTGTVQTSSYLKGRAKKHDSAQFWTNLTKMAEKAGKIESIDNRR